MIADISVTEKSFGSKMLYNNLRFSIQAGEKVGVVGRNGVGKSTLFGILAGTDTDYTGEVVYKKGLVVVASRQEHHGFEDIPVLEYILGDLPEYADLKHIIDTYPETMGDNMRLITEYSETLERFETLGYYTVEDSIIRELATFQIDEDKARAPLGQLSGGQKRLAEVVKVMHARAHLALIDEPTNHMDFVAKDQFITWMSDAQEAMLIITHDRDVLGKVDRIIEIKDGRAHSYAGNYDAYLRQNTHATTTGMHDYETVQRQITNLKAKVVQFRRFKEKARDPDTIKQFKRRETQAAAELAELEKTKKPTFWIDKDSAEGLNYKVGENYQKFKAKNIRIQGMQTGASKSSRLLVEASDISLGYAHPLFTPVNFQLRENERLEFRGRNGAGKSTLIKMILEAAGYGVSGVQHFGGRLAVTPGIAIGVHEQEAPAGYHDLSLYAAIERTYLDRDLPISDQKIRQLMNAYLFESFDAETPVGRLSGGQKARLQLIAMLAREPQLLILDEPTNHLDLPSIEELETALARYSGAVIYVSHDGYFRQSVGGEVVVVAG